MNLSTEKKIMDVEKRRVVAKGEGEGGELMGSLGFVDANYDIANGWAMRSCCIAQGTLSSLLGENMMEDYIRKGMYIYV